MYFAIAVALGTVANVSAFLVLHRMKSPGRVVGLWRAPKDFGSYKEYWRIGPAKGWSRAPLILGGSKRFSRHPAANLLLRDILARPFANKVPVNRGVLCSLEIRPRVAFAVSRCLWFF
jgi:hypothetical protein